MLKLSGGNVEVHFFPSQPRTTVYRITDRVDRIGPLRRNEALLAKGNEIPKGFAVYLALRSNAEILKSLPVEAETVVSPDDYDYLADGDVIRIRPGKGAASVLYRRNSAHNSFLLTERCNHYCLMCSQRPRDINDSWIVDDVLAAIPLIDTATAEIGFTGGEPTLLGDDFIRILNKG
jgi:sulfatase maturation enzyme AslB (radical SAM superfamily)